MTHSTNAEGHGERSRTMSSPLPLTRILILPDGVQLIGNVCPTCPGNLAITDLENYLAHFETHGKYPWERKAVMCNYCHKLRPLFKFAGRFRPELGPCAYCKAGKRTKARVAA